ncbi:hypothetical protein CY35_03G077000 [Sphagnum magellanicum]|nr:hypothetical protein CY35_03G077000 [Sphagnum magellanicum]
MHNHAGIEPCRAAGQSSVGGGYLMSRHPHEVWECFRRLLLRKRGVGFRLSCSSQTMEYLISLSPWTWVMVVTLTLVATASCFAFFGFSNPMTETGMLPEATSSCLPIVGDSPHFLWQGPHQFVANQISRFQEFFKLSILGLDPIIVGTSPEFVKFVLAHKSLQPSYPTRFTKLVCCTYDVHSLTRNQIDTLARRCTFATFSGENLHTHLPFLNSLARQVVDSLQSMGTILDIQGEISKYAMSAALQLGWPEMVGTEDANKIKEEMLKIQDGMHSNIQINLPPFTWYKALKATTSLLGRIEKSMAKRREKGIQYKDLLGHVMEDASVEQLSDHDKCVAIRCALFGASTGVILSLTMVVKYLHDYPQVKESIKVEQDALREKMIEGNSLEWFNWKTSMPLTTQMINEVLRHHSVMQFIPRETPKNMKYKDYNIPRNGKYGQHHVQYI